MIDLYSSSIHFLSSLIVAIQGFLVGLILSLVFSAICAISYKARYLISSVSILIYSIPIIVSGFILSTFVGPDLTGVFLGAMGAFLPLYFSSLNELDNKKIGYENLCTVYSYSKFNYFRYIQVPLILRGVLLGSYSSWMWAVLGALIGDFSGKRWGVGTYLVGSVTQGSEISIFMVIFMSFLISLFGFIIFSNLSKLFMIDGKYDVLQEEGYRGDASMKGKEIYYYRFIVFWAAISVLSYFLFYIDKDLLGIRVLVFNSFLLGLLGVLVSIFLSLTLAILKEISGFLIRPIMAVFFITQITPIIAFIPLIAYLFGREEITIVLVVILSTIYPSYLLISKKFQELPIDVKNINSIYGGGRFTLIKYFILPNSAPSLLSALRMTFGRAILGVVTAEYLITGTGIGGLIGSTRALLDYNMIFIICVIILCLNVLIDLVLEWAEKVVVNIFYKKTYYLRNKSPAYLSDIAS